MPRTIAVVGMLFGDEGKGATVSALCARLPGRKLVVRASGGPQAAHNIVVPQSGDQVHTCSQIGSGVFHGADTFIAGETVLDIDALQLESTTVVRAACRSAQRLQLGRVFVHPRTPVLDSRDASYSWSEARRSGHGSCGRGTGVCFQRARDPHHIHRVADDAERRISATGPDSVLTVVGTPRLSDYDYIISECGQGTLLDREFGFAPYASWTSQRAFDVFCAMYGLPQPFRVGVIRAYATRHGFGPLLYQYDNPPAAFVDPNNAEDLPEIRGPMRYAPHSVAMLKYSQRCYPVDALVVNHVDCADEFEYVVEEPSPAWDRFTLQADMALTTDCEYARWDELQRLAERLAAVPQSVTDSQRHFHLHIGYPQLLGSFMGIPASRCDGGSGPADDTRVDNILRYVT